MQDTNLFKRHEQAVAELILGAKQNLTAPSGSQVFHSDLSDPDNDVTTVVGPAAGAAGVAQWVGDTTAPGVPTGITATSKQGIVYATWDGTLDGGIPEDFGQVNLLVGGTPVGHLVRAGTLPVDGLTAGATVQVTATAQDLARAQDGTLAPNVSAACDPVTVTVESAVSQADLDNAQAQIDQAKLDITTAQDAADNALTKATTANTTAGQAAATATAAKPLIQSDVPTTDEQVQDRLWIDTAARTYAWTGAANSSTSTESVDGVVQRTNLLQHPQGGAAWFTKNNAGTGTIAVTPPAGCAHAFSYTTSIYPWMGDPTTLINGTVYTLHMWAKSSTAGWAHFGQYSTDTVQQVVPLTADNWTEITYTFTAKQTATSGVGFGIDATASTTLSIADPILEAASTVGPYFDGDTSSTAANTPKRWDGSQWSPVTDGTAVQAAQDAATAQTTANTAQSTATAAQAAASQAQSAADAAAQDAEDKSAAAQQAAITAAAADATAKADAAQAAATTAAAQDAQAKADAAKAAAISSASADAQAKANAAEEAAKTAAAADAAAKAQAAQSAAQAAAAQDAKAKADAAQAAANSYADQLHDALASTLADFTDETTQNFSTLQNQVDGAIDTWYLDGVPTLSDAPASDWTDEATRAQHEGDLYFDKQSGKSYRFFKNGDTWAWTLVQDTDITKALADAADAQDTADSKRRVFVVQPTPPYDTGDLWTQGSGGNLMRCKTGRGSGSYVAADWELATKYTDDTVAYLAQQKATDAATAATAAQTTADGKNAVFTQTSEPNHAGLVQGDLWRVLTVMADGSRRVTGQQVWNGTAFVADQMVADSILVPGSAGTVSIADGAITTPKLLAGKIDANTVLASDSVTAAKISATTEMLTKILSARKIIADDIDVGSLAAAIVTSKLFRTSPTVGNSTNGQGLIVDSDGLRAYDSAGNETVNLNGPDANITSATIRSAPSGARTEMNDYGFYQIDSSGNNLVEIGSNVPNGFRVRNPYTNSMQTLSQLAFGGTYFQEYNSSINVVCGNGDFGAWWNYASWGSITATTSHFMVIWNGWGAKNGSDYGGTIALNINLHTAATTEGWNGSGLFWGPASTCYVTVGNPATPNGSYVGMDIVHVTPGVTYYPFFSWRGVSGDGGNLKITGRVCTILPI